MSERRKRFEHWYASEYEPVDLTICEADNEYFSADTQLAWEAWQAAKKDNV